jgi:hypothetical protein
MGRRKKGGGNPLTKGLSRLIDDVAGEVLDGAMDVAGGAKKSKKKGSGSANHSTDWATRTEDPAPRKRRSR